MFSARLQNFPASSYTSIILYGAVNVDDEYDVWVEFSSLVMLIVCTLPK